MPSIHAWLASAYDLNAEIDRALRELERVRGLSHGGQYTSIAWLKAVAHFGAAQIRTLFEGTYLAGLRRAGMTED